MITVSQLFTQPLYNYYYIDIKTVSIMAKIHTMRGVI